MLRVRPVGIFIALLLAALPTTNAATNANLFGTGLIAYESGQFAAAARAFRESATNAATPGALRNLGLSEWRRGRAGAAICAWEQVLWIAPYDAASRGNLAYARRSVDVESPHWHWYERVSAWLPFNGWAWITAAGLWLTLAAILLPDILRRRRSAWSQAGAAVGLMVLLSSLPAQLGVLTRRQIGFVLQRETPLRLTPTNDSEIITKLPNGDPARKLRAHGNYVLVKTTQGEGWVERRQFGLIVPE